MRKKHRKTLDDIFSIPIKANIGWRDIESLLVSLDAEIKDGRGSRVRIKLNGVWAVFHRPHPQKETDKGAVKAMREFFNAAGVSENG